jgi:PKD repeat protein
MFNSLRFYPLLFTFLLSACGSSGSGSDSSEQDTNLSSSAASVLSSSGFTQSSVSQNSITSASSIPASSSKASLSSSISSSLLTTSSSVRSTISSSNTSSKSSAVSSFVSSSLSSNASASSLSSTSLVAEFEYEARDRTLSVDDAGSSAGSSTITSYSWNYGDGGSATGKTPPPYTYAADGTYEVTLTITAANGQSKSVTQEITVADRVIGSYAPSSATTGVPQVVKDRLYLLDLEKPNVSSTNTPTTAEETLVVSLNNGSYRFTWNGSAIQIPAEFAYVKNGRLFLDRLHIRGYIDIRAHAVTLQRSIIEALLIPEAIVEDAPLGINAGRRLLKGNNVATSDILVEDVELFVPASLQRGPNVNDAYHHGLAVEASRMILNRVNIHGTVDGMQIHQGKGSYTDVVVQKSWIHDMQYYPLDWERKDGDPTHSDAIQVECSLPADGEVFGVRLLGNTLDMTNDPNHNSVIMVTKNACGTHGLQIAFNYLDGAPAPINIGDGLESKPITVYANDNRFGPNRTTGTSGSKSWMSSTSAKVMFVKANNDSSSAYENYDPTKTHKYVYFSYDPPSQLGAQPPTNEENRNVIINHERGQESWGTNVLDTGKIGLY